MPAPQGIGLATPLRLTGSGDVAVFHSSGATGGLQIHAFVDGATGSYVQGKKGRGTASVPLRTRSGDALVSFGGAGYAAVDNTTTATEVTGLKGRVRAVATEDWTTTANGSKLDFTVTPNGTATPVIALTLDHDSSFSWAVVMSSWASPVKVNPYRPLNFAHTITQTDNADALVGVSQGIRSEVGFGVGGVASIGTIHAATLEAIIRGAGSANNEYTSLFGSVRADIGTGYEQAVGPAGGLWLADMNMHGPIAVQPDKMIGFSVFVNNYYNGNPTNTPSSGMAITTKPGSGGSTDAAHVAATTYPMQVGLLIQGESSGSANGFNTGIQLGGTGQPWGPAATRMTTGIDLSTATISGAGINVGTHTVLFAERADPSAPAANGATLYAKDSGGGKTQLVARFATGAVQVIAVEP